MRVGVVMPTYNQAQWLPGALASVVDLDHAGLCVVNDGSTDSTAKVLKAFDDIGTDFWTLEPGRNEGTAAAINRGVDSMSVHMEALTWVSSDNVMHRGWLPTLTAELENGAGAAYGGFYYCTPERVSYLFKPYDPELLINDVNCYFGPAFLIRKDVWLEAGPHRGRISHDYDHWLRVEEVCWRRGLPIVGVDQPLCWYSAHDKRVTVTRAREFDAHHWQAEARKRRGIACMLLTGSGSNSGGARRALLAASEWWLSCSSVRSPTSTPKSGFGGGACHESAHPLPGLLSPALLNWRHPGGHRRGERRG